MAHQKAIVPFQSAKTDQVRMLRGYLIRLGLLGQSDDFTWLIIKRMKLAMTMPATATIMLSINKFT